MPSVMINNTLTGEITKVATFKTMIEATQTAALFNAMLESEDKMYYSIQYRHKGRLLNTRPSSFRSVVSNVSTLYAHLKPIF